MKTRMHILILAGACLGWLAASPASAQPIITSQPTNHFANTPGSFNFYVGASGTAPLSYQWLFDGVPIAGATHYYLSVISPQPAQWGYYSVIVSNDSGSVTSQVAELKIFTAARHSLSSIQAQPDGSMNLSFAGETPAAFGPYYDLYPLECSSNLVDWAPLVTVQRSNTALDTLDFVDTNAPTLSQRFYRTPTNQLATPDPAPTGPYGVGTFSMVMIDSSRTNRAGGTNYQFMTTFWYPAVAQAGALPAIYVEPQIATSGYYNFTPGGSDFSSQVMAFYSHSWSNAPLATNLTTYPVLLYSPGSGDLRIECIDRAEELASWGYVVVALDTSDSFISVFPGGKIVYQPIVPPSPYTHAYFVGATESRVLDMQFVLDQLAVLNANDPRLAARLDLEKIGAFGFSMGGMAVLELCARDPRCKACASSDFVFLEPNLMTQPLGFPWLHYRSDWGPDPGRDWIGQWQDMSVQLFSQQRTNAYWVKVGSTVHWDFADAGLIADSTSLASYIGTPMSGQIMTGGRLSQILRPYLLSFFNKHLMGQDDHLLDGPSPAYPEVIEFLSAGAVSGPPRNPVAALVQGSVGNLYGTSAYGGAYGQGTVYQVTTNGDLTTLVSFNGTNGSRPSAALLQASDGTFYGTTAFGGTNGNHGTVFQLTTGGVLTTLLSFDGTNGSEPFAGLIQGSDGNFYGTTVMGGANNLGTVFQMMPAGALTTLFSFNGTNNGSFPFASLVQGTNGNFYGTTSAYGTADGDSPTGHAAIAFQVTPAGVLTPLTSLSGANGADSASALAPGTNEYFYGTSEYGGNTSLNGANGIKAGFGTVFQMTPAGALGILVRFNGANGSYCVSGLVQGSDGNFYGTTAGGGWSSTVTGGGTVFKMTPAGVLTTLVSFNGANGSSPQAPLIQGRDGNFYGTTTYGGPNGGGTVFQVTTNGVLTTLAGF